MKDLIFLGIQGSGKGTQGDLLVEKYGFKKFETGKILRSLANQNTPLGEQVKSIIESGELVPSDIVYQILEDFLANLAPGKAAIFDSVTRNQSQYLRFKELMQKFERTFEIVLFEISEEEAIRRLAERKICPNCKKNYPYFYTDPNCEDCQVELIKRADDQNKEAVLKRLHIFQTETLPIVELLEQDGGELITIDGEPPIEQVFGELERNLKEKKVIA